jgi:enamine deaminase RidA (YjgF/YER057c/UK114 family)
MTRTENPAPSSFEAQLAALALELPEVPVPVANFAPYRISEKLIVLAGQVCEWNGEVRYIGKVGIDFDLATAQQAARICALNLIAALRRACDGNLDRISHCVRLGGFVNCPPDYPDIPHVIDGASNLMRELFGEQGVHARTAVGVINLPRGAAVEVDAMFALR